jgi:hypothetical protein
MVATEELQTGAKAIAATSSNHIGETTNVVDLQFPVQCAVKELARASALRALLYQQRKRPGTTVPSVVMSVKGSRTPIALVAHAAWPLADVGCQRPTWTGGRCGRPGP